MKLILTTWNPQKVKWLTGGFSNTNLEIEVIDPQRAEAVDETGITCEENAALKVNASEIQHDEIFVGEDSGLFIEALNGFPGVNTVRWSGGNDDDRGRRILDMMKNIPVKNRSAYFKSSIAVKFPNQDIEIISGVMKGNISEKFLGDTGKGYRNIFILESGKYIAESGSGIVQKNDHRDLAMQKASQLIIDWIRNNSLENDTT